MGADWQSVLLDGQTAIMNGPRGVHAVGVVSGKRLWARPVRGRVLLRDPVLRESTLDAARGLVACVLSPGVLSVVGVLDGRPVWEREVATNPAAVRIRDDVVLTADPKLETVQAYGADNGRLLATMVFRQPVSDTLTATYMTVPIVYSAGILCGPDGKALKAYDVRTGDQVWSLDLGDYPAGLFELDEGRFVVGTADGHHRVIEARSGEVTFEEELGDFPGGAIFGTADCDLLILAGYEETGEGDRWNLVGVDMKTGQVRWSRSFVGLMSHSHLRLAQGVIPVVVSGMRDQEPSQRREGWRSRQEVWLIDKQSGQNVGEPLVWDGVARGDQLTGELAIWPGRLVLQATQGIVMYETEPAALGVGGVD